MKLIYTYEDESEECEPYKIEVIFTVSKGRKRQLNQPAEPAEIHMQDMSIKEEGLTGEHSSWILDRFYERDDKFDEKLEAYIWKQLASDYEDCE